ncbi:flagellar basal body-associated protein FliL [Virgibacillus sp. 179-BFC.A HS]|uniref:Flagellar protein FliL n=1 Tax=Tigheibacillus jepli TaxID=3035914 RepID=A0ABU5CHQ2_9BACI|nr:flagellar basal body-associated protein FliL [Virgibacillus sp. 179-BFC.A HS]MDY0405877.1 flagellar basal body-associated protein FliL [Virgibacillus sp. 179-BFC.A HS]
MSKVTKILLVTMVSVLLIGIIVFIVLYLTDNKTDKGSAQSIDEMVEYSYQTPEITTDLADGSFVRIQFQVITDGKAANKEIAKREFQIKNIIIKEMATMSKKKFKTGLGEMEASLKTRLNEVMKDGKVTNVYTISKILQ